MSHTGFVTIRSLFTRPFRTHSLIAYYLRDVNVPNLVLSLYYYNSRFLSRPINAQTLPTGIGDDKWVRY